MVVVMLHLRLVIGHQHIVLGCVMEIQQSRTGWVIGKHPCEPEMWCPGPVAALLVEAIKTSNKL